MNDVIKTGKGLLWRMKYGKPMKLEKITIQKLMKLWKNL